jgi:hypothetical protein
VCPPETVAKKRNGNLSLNTTDGAPFYGGIGTSLTTTGDTSPDSGLAIDRFPTGDKVHYERTITLSDEAAKSLREGTGVVVVHGIDYNGNGKYDNVLGPSDLDPSLPSEATNPALCGTQTGVNTSAAAAGAALRIVRSVDAGTTTADRGRPRRRKMWSRQYAVDASGQMSPVGQIAARLPLDACMSSSWSPSLPMRHRMRAVPAASARARTSAPAPPRLSRVHRSTRALARLTVTFSVQEALICATALRERRATARERPNSAPAAAEAAAQPTPSPAQRQRIRFAPATAAHCAAVATTLAGPLPGVPGPPRAVSAVRWRSPGSSRGAGRGHTSR